MQGVRLTRGAGRGILRVSLRHGIHSKSPELTGRGKQREGFPAPTLPTGATRGAWPFLRLGGGGRLAAQLDAGHGRPQAAPRIRLGVAADGDGVAGLRFDILQ